MWKIPQIWPDGECWIIGGGPSIPRQLGVPDATIQAVLQREADPSVYAPYFEPIKHKHIIGVNAAFLIGSFLDMVFFGDGNFYVRNRRELNEYEAVKVTCNSKAMRKFPNDNVKIVNRDNQHPVGITNKRNSVSWNNNSGMASISLAYHLGVRTVYLLGFDMKVDENSRQHWHAHYRKGPKFPERTFRRHMKGNIALSRDAKRLGMRLINVNPDSAIDTIKRVAFKDLQL